MSTAKKIEVVEQKSAPTQITTMSLVQQAIDQNADIDKLEKFMNLHLRWEENEARKAYNEAMSRFREECPTINRTRKGHNNKFAGLAETTEVVNPILAKHGISYRWDTSQDQGVISVSCTVTHTLGHSETTTLSAGSDTSGSKNSIQAIGSTVSYLERYTLFAILGLSSREMMDDDGGGASVDPVKVIDDNQLANLEALVTETGTDDKKFCKFLKVDALHMLPAAGYDFAVDALEKKRGK